MSPPLYKIQSVPGKGRGLVASFDIAQGTRILIEEPLVIILAITPAAYQEGAITTQFKALSDQEKDQYLTLHNNHTGSKAVLSAIFKTNSLACGPDARAHAVYHTICLINHSCLPNTQHKWNKALNMETIHATRAIKAGEEITIMYTKPEICSKRRAHLKDSFGFDCTCEICSLPAAEIAKSDARILQIDQLHDAIGSPKHNLSRPDLSLVDCYKMLRLLDEEYHGGAKVFEADAYFDVFQLTISFGDQARASVFAERAYKARMMKSLMENPAKHEYFGMSKKWESAKGDVSKGLGPTGFEKWLWRSQLE